MKNQWQALATRAKTIQRTKNNVLWPVLLPLVKTFAPRGRVFDDGCGWGEFADHLAGLGYSVVASDLASRMVSAAKKRFQRARFLSISELRKNAQTLNGSFDLVTSNLVLCILPPTAQRRTLRRLKAFLKPGGTIIVTLCHPCFDTEPNSSVSTRAVPKHRCYADEFRYTKRIKENGIVFSDFHRPLEYYLHLFAREGLVIISGAESLVEKAPYKPDFITFVLKTSVSKSLSPTS